MHWTQTAKGKAILKRRSARIIAKNKSKTARRTIAKANSTSRNTAHVNSSQQIDPSAFSYALGWTECWLQTFAQGAAVPPELLAAGVGKVLSSKNRR